MKRMPKDQKNIAVKEAKKDGRKEGKKDDKPKRQIPLTEEEKVAHAKIDKCDKQLDELTASFKDVMGKLREKDSARAKQRSAIFDNRDALKKIFEQIEEKKSSQNEFYGRAQKYIEALRKRKTRRADERAELVKLLPHDAELPPLREDDDAAAVSDYDRAIKIVQRELERMRDNFAANGRDERKLIAATGRWNAVIEKIKELEAKAAAPLAELAEVDVMTCLEACRRLKTEIQKLQDSCLPHYAAIEEAVQKSEEIRADVPKLIKERDNILARIKEVVSQLHDAQYEYDVARFKAQKVHNEKRRAEALKESQEIKARLEEIRKNREARIQKAMNALPYDREVAVATEVLASLRSVALPGTCDIPESAASAPKAKAQPAVTSAPAVEIEEASFGKTEMIVSRKTQPVPKVGKKQNKKKKAAAAAAAEDAPKEPKKKTKEDAVRVPPFAANRLEELSLNVPETYGELEETYKAVKERLENYERIRATVREQHEKELREAQEKAEEEAAAKAKEKADAEAAKPAETAEEPAAEEPAAAPAAEEPAAESQ